MCHLTRTFSDDPVAAVDPPLVTMIVENIISKRGILPACTKIVTTHNKTLLAAADHVIVMKAGAIVASGALMSEKVMEAAAECVGWDEQQQKSGQGQAVAASAAEAAAAAARYRPPLQLVGSLFDHASSMQVLFVANIVIMMMIIIIKVTILLD